MATNTALPPVTNDLLAFAIPIVLEWGLALAVMPSLARTRRPTPPAAPPAADPFAPA